MKPLSLGLVVLLLLTSACAAPTAVLTATPTAVSTTTPSPAATATSAPAISAEAAAYLEAAIAIMEANGINRLHLDWAALRVDAFEAARHAQTPADTYDIIRSLLRKAGGKHSGFMPPSAASDLQQATASDSPPARGTLLLDRLGYIAIEGFGSPDAAASTEYATHVQQLIRDVDAQTPCGWIVDLRENTGGNMYPMLAGLGPILGEGVAGFFVDPEGLQTPWSYEAGAVHLADEAGPRVAGPAYTLHATDVPVAVLTGINTASSGEAVAISFRGRPHTRSFGHYTAGLSTGNAGFPLSDGAMLILTTVVMADRTGTTYGEQVDPDVKVDDVRQYTMLMGEAIPQPAIDWLLEQSACRLSD
jgi:hypothetical protein